MPPELRFGKYIIEGLLGPGGVTETYLAHVQEKMEMQAQSSRLFAVKLLRRDRVPASAYAGVAARFVSAGQQLRGFHRPGLGKVVEVSDGVSEDAPACFIASEHVAGRDLNRLVETCRDEPRSGIDPLLAGLVGAEVARLIHVGHAAKPAFHHLGLSPANVVVTEAGEVVLLDAGIAASVRAITEQPPERWAFVAPELHGVDAGAPGFDDQRAVAADLFSLGLLLVFLVSGRPPPVDAITGKVAVGKLVDDPGIPSKLAAALRTLLAPEPEDRPESAAVLVEWLAEGLGSVRERQALIAQGVRVAQMGAAAPENPAVPIKHAPPLMPTPRLLVDGAENSAEEASLARAKAGTWTRILFLVVCAGVMAGALVAGIWRWPGRNEGTTVSTQTGKVERQRDAKPESAATASAESTPSVTAKTDEEAQAQRSATGESILARAAGHLIAETVPPGAMVWVDGVLVGKTFADITVGAGGHRIVLIAPGHRMFRHVVDTSQGAILRQTLPAVDAPSRGDGFINAHCFVASRYPLLLDDEETGLLCPAKMIPATAGKHVVGIFVPRERRVLSVEITVETGSKPALASFNE